MSFSHFLVLTAVFGLSQATPGDQESIDRSKFVKTVIPFVKGKGGTVELLPVYPNDRSRRWEIDLSRTRVSADDLRQLISLFAESCFTRLPDGSIRIHGLSGEVDCFGDGIWRIKLSKTDTDDSGLSAMFEQLHSLSNLDISYTNVSGEGLRKHADKLQALSGLSLNGMKIDKGTAAIISKFKSLHVFSSQRASIGPGVWNELAKAPALESIYVANSHIADQELDPVIWKERKIHLIDLSGTDVSDQFVRSLVHLKSLRFLRLSHTCISSRAIESLTNLSGLSHIDLRGTEIDEAAIAGLQKAHPNLEISR